MTPNRVNRAHWPTKENRPNFVIVWIFPAYGENYLGWPQMGPGGFFVLLIQTLPTFWAEHLCILRFLTLLIFRIPNFWISRSPDFQIPRPRPGPGLGRTWAGRRTVRGTSATPPRHLRTTKLMRSEELGQYRENPISASPVWGIMLLSQLRHR